MCDQCSHNSNKLRLLQQKKGMRFASNKIPTHFNVMPFRFLSIPNLYIYIFFVCITFFLSFYCRKTFPFRKEFTMETFKSHETYKRENWHDGHHQNFVYEYDRHDLHDDDHQWIQGSLMSQSLSVGNSTIWNMPKKKARTWKKEEEQKYSCFLPDLAHILSSLQLFFRIWHTKNTVE